MAQEGRSASLPYPYPNLETSQWDPEQILKNFQYLASNISRLTLGQLVPSGTMILMRSGSTCPSGYTQVTTAALAGRFLRISLTTAGATGGSTLSGLPSSTRLVTSAASGTTVLVSRGTHIHSVTPKYLDIILCEKD